MHIKDLIHPSLVVSAKEIFGDVTSLTANDSEVKPGSLFFAVRGTSRDGHDFVKAAQAKGAVGVVLERGELFRETPNAVHVRNSREALAHAASRFHGEPSRRLQVVGLTGTNGKTTTTYLLRKIWRALELKSGIVGTVEYHIGDRTEPSSLTTPDPLVLQSLFREMVDESVKVAAIEVSSIALDQHRATGTRFEVGVFTNLTQDHLDYHGTLESYYEAKRKLFTDLAPAAAVINVDDSYGRRLFQETTAPVKFSFSLESPKADFRAESARFEGSGTTATLVSPRGKLQLRTPLIGKHNLYNCLGVLATVHAMNHDLALAVAGLSDAMGAPGRLERAAPGEGRPHVFVDYAHTDDALLNVLSALDELRRGTAARLITVFGCGGDRDRGKRPKMADVASRYSEITIATSDNPRTESPEGILDDIEAGIRKNETEYHREVNRREAIRLALRLARPDDLVLIAGKGHETYQILGKEKFPFDDREVVRDYYRT